MSLKKMNYIKTKVSVERLAEAVEYNPKTGGFVWRVRPNHHFDSTKSANRWNGKYSGKPAFTSRGRRGYYRGVIDGCPLYAHRAALAIFSGEWPDGEVDHINRNKSDNRAFNLRSVTHSENRRNSDNYEMAQKRKEGRVKSKPKLPAGVRRQSKTTWSIRIKRKGKEKYLGAFKCFGAALKARKAAL